MLNPKSQGVHNMTTNASIDPLSAEVPALFCSVPCSVLLLRLLACSALELINMITNALIRRAKEDKKCHRSCQSKNPKMTHSSFWSREFSGDDVFFVVGSASKTLKAANKIKMVIKMRIGQNSNCQLTN